LYHVFLLASKIPTGVIIAKKQVNMEIGKQVKIQADAVYHEKPAVTLERLARLEGVMMSEIEEIKKMMKAE
jgi:hypothetical protein